MNAKHTPGPWTVVHDPSRRTPTGQGMLTSIYATDREDERINRQIGAAYSDIQGWPLSDAVQRLVIENAEANARLIAAAPALLAALEFIVNDTPSPGDDAVLSVEGYNRACAALAAARGAS